MAAGQKFVIDASALLSFLLPDEQLPPQLERIFEELRLHQIILLAPELLRYEVGNALASSCLKARLDAEAAQALLEAFLSLNIEYKNVDQVQVLNLSLKHQLTAYDTAYLWLAKTANVPLLTLDKRLSKIALD